MHKDVTLATVFDLFLESLSGSVEELKTTPDENQGGKTGSNLDAV